MTDTEFLALSDRVLRSIGAALDRAIDASDTDADWSENDGVLTIEGNAGKIIVNRHVPNREIWLATRGGGQHFRLDGGTWRDTRSGGELATALGEALLREAGLSIDLPGLPVD